MRFILLLFGLPALAWSGYWYVGATAKEQVMRAWLEERAAAGWRAEVAELQVGGFPYRFDTELKGVELADPVSGVSWSAPWFEILALSYKPTHVIAVWPETQSITTPDGRVEIRAGQMRGSAEFDAGTDLALDELVVDMADVTLTGAGWDSGFDKALVATRRHGSDARAHDVSVEARNVRLTERTRRFLDPKAVLPAVFETLLAQAAFTFDGPLDRTAIEIGRPAITHVTIDKFQATWGRLDLRAEGAVTIGPDGRPEGTINLRAKNWREMVELAVNVGALSQGDAGKLTSALGIVSQMTGDGETLDAPLRFAAGLTFFGPLPIGTAPRIMLH